MKKNLYIISKEVEENSLIMNSLRDHDLAGTFMKEINFNKEKDILFEVDKFKQVIFLQLVPGIDTRFEISGEILSQAERMEKLPVQYININSKILKYESFIKPANKSHSKILVPKLTKRTISIASSKISPLYYDFNSIWSNELISAVSEELNQKTIIDSVTSQEMLSENLIEEINLQSDYSLEKFKNEYSLEIKSLLDSLKYNNSQKITLEGGHIYADERISNELLHNLRCFSHLRSILESKSYTVKGQLFVDNYNIENSKYIFNQDLYLNIARKLGIDFDDIKAEKDMCKIAHVVINHLDSLGFVGQAENGELWYKNGSANFRLTVKSDSKNLEDGARGLKYSCALLDSSLSIVKLFSDRSSVINILPIRYKGQQGNMKSLATKIPGVTKNRLLTFYL